MFGKGLTGITFIIVTIFLFLPPNKKWGPEAVLIATIGTIIAAVLAILEVHKIW